MILHACGVFALALISVVPAAARPAYARVRCYQLEHMLAMIDILVAKGTLSESDWPHCVHWTVIRGAGGLTQDDLGRVLDADAMREKAGTRTLTGEGARAIAQGPEAMEALHPEWFGEPGADDI